MTTMTMTTTMATARQAMGYDNIFDGARGVSLSQFLDGACGVYLSLFVTEHAPEPENKKNEGKRSTRNRISHFR